MQYFFTSFKVTFGSINLKFSKIVLLKINGSCLIIDILFLNDSSVKSFMSTSSKVIVPLVGSKSLVIKLNKVDFPSPDDPTIAIFLLGSNVILKLFNISFSFG